METRLENIGRSTVNYKDVKGGKKGCERVLNAILYLWNVLRITVMVKSGLEGGGPRGRAEWRFAKRFGER